MRAIEHQHTLSDYIYRTQLDLPFITHNATFAIIFFI